MYIQTDGYQLQGNTIYRLSRYSHKCSFRQLSDTNGLVNWVYIFKFYRVFMISSASLFSPWSDSAPSNLKQRTSSCGRPLFLGSIYITVSFYIHQNPSDSIIQALGLNIFPKIVMRGTPSMITVIASHVHSPGKKLESWLLSINRSLWRLQLKMS